MKAIGVIPARWASTRFAGKVLASIAGKPMIQRVWEQACKAKKLNDLLIACDEERVRKVVERFGGKAIMTAKNHPSGTDRIAQAVSKIKCDVVVNIQGDEPLIDPKLIDSVIAALQKDRVCVMATAAKLFHDGETLNNPNIVKVVLDKNNRALYFSRHGIPFNRDKKPLQKIRYYKHFGIYGYRRDFLLKFKDMPRGILEQIEKLEQLRALENGYAIKVVVTKTDSVGVDIPEDVRKVEAVLKKRKI